MNRWAWRSGAAGAIVTVAAMVTMVAMMGVGPAVAAPRGEIVQITSAKGRIDLVFQGVELPADADVDPSSAVVSIDGTRVPATATRLDSASRPLTRAAILVIDVSGSMTGRIAAAKQASSAFLAGVPDDVRVGLITFSDRPRLDVPPTTDRAALRAAVDGLDVDAGGGTALYDATMLATRTVGTKGPRNVLVLSDGADESSSASLAEAVADIRAGGVDLDAVLFGSDRSGIRALRGLTGAAGGRTIQTSRAARLAAAFEGTARVITNQLAVTAEVPPGLAGTSATVTVSATAGDLVLSDGAYRTLSAAPRDRAGRGDGPVPVRADPPAAWVSDALPVWLGALFAGLLLLLLLGAGAMARPDDQRGGVRRRLSIYTLTGRQAAAPPAASTALGSSHVARSAVELATKVVKQRDLENALAQRLDAAGVPLRVAEWMLIQIGVAVGGALLLLLVSGGALLATLAGLGLGLALPWIYLNVKESRRTSSFLTQLPDTLQLMAGSLSVGHSLPQTIDTVVKEGQQPIATEFNRALVEARLGVPVEDALDGVAERMKSRDFAWVVMAIRIQHQVGGNLAELLSTVAETMRERDRLRRQVKVLSAEGRLSAWILGLLPPTFALYLLLVRPEYLQPLVSERLGWVMIGIGVMLLALGSAWMRKAVRVEV